MITRLRKWYRLKFRIDAPDRIAHLLTLFVEKQRPAPPVMGWHGHRVISPMPIGIIQPYSDITYIDELHWSGPIS